MTLFVKKTGAIFASLTLMVGIALAIGTGNFQPNEIKADSPSSLYKSYSFIDGGSSSNSAYSGVNLATNISYASDNPGGTSGTTAWEADYANLSLTNGTRLGGKLVSAVQTDNTTAWANIKTTFAVDKSIDVVKVYNAGAFGTKSNVGDVYLQYSSTGTTWTTVKTITAATLNYPTAPVSPAYTTSLTIVFDGFTIPANSYLRFGVALTASSTNSGLVFSQIALHSYTQC